MSIRTETEQNKLELLTNTETWGSKMQGNLFRKTCDFYKIYRTRCSSLCGWCQNYAVAQHPQETCSCRNAMVRNDWQGWCAPGNHIDYFVLVSFVFYTTSWCFLDQRQRKAQQTSWNILQNFFIWLHAHS